MSKVAKIEAFEVTDKIRCTDPCYTREVTEPETNPHITDGLTATATAKPGRWQAEVEHVEQWGGRNASLLVHHEDFPLASGFIDWKRLGKCAVDSGQFGFYADEKFPEGSTGDVGDESFYGRNCSTTTDNETNWGIITEGVVSSSGYGDGWYPVDRHEDTDGKVIALRVTFIDESDEW